MALVRGNLFYVAEVHVLVVAAVVQTRWYMVTKGHPGTSGAADGAVVPTVRRGPRIRVIPGVCEWLVRLAWGFGREAPSIAQGDTHGN